MRSAQGPTRENRQEVSGQPLAGKGKAGENATQWTAGIAEEGMGQKEEEMKRRTAILRNEKNSVS